MQSDDRRDTLDTPPSAARILARSFYRELRSHGYKPSELVAVSTELIELVTRELRSEREGVTFAA